MNANAPLHISMAHTAADMAAVRELFGIYARSLSVSLDFQGFEQEILNLAAAYAPPRAALWIARAGDVAVGCCALRPLDTADYPNAAEMRRLFVLPSHRGQGLGRQLAEAALDEARHMGYSCVLLDTLSEMETARALYAELGFVEVQPYYFNPIAGAHYLKADL